MAVPTPETQFTRDILGNYVCNALAEATSSGCDHHRWRDVRSLRKICFSALADGHSVCAVMDPVGVVGIYTASS